MCIAIYKPAGKIISYETLEQCFRSNPDGAGFLISNGKEIKIRKGFFTFDAFWQAFEPFKEEQCLIHFRIKTHGEVSIKNCHPFYINNQVGFIHNGVISKHSSNVNYSDTRDFNETILRPMVRKFGPSIVFSEEFQTLIENYIGYSKLIFMDNKGNFSIFNEKQGEWHEGVWYSNSSYKVYKYKGNKWSKNYGYGYDEEFYPITEPVYYLKKPYGNKIHEGDFAKVSYSYKGLVKDSLVEVKSIRKDCFCDVETLSGDIIPGFPGAYLEYIELSKSELTSEGLVVPS